MRGKASRERFLGELEGFPGRGGQQMAVQSKGGHSWVLKRTPLSHHGVLPWVFSARVLILKVPCNFLLVKMNNFS